MTETLRDMMTARADAAPGPNIDIQGVVRNGQRRVWRHRAVGGTATGAVLAAVVLVAPTLPFVGGDGSPSFSDGVGERQISYASGSTIHYGDRSIDVSPHEVASYVQTDDGFVYATTKSGVYFTDGGSSEQIGHAGGVNWLVADDFGSYVGWIEADADSGTEAVVFDTARGAEVFRSPADDGAGDGCFSDPGLVFSAIDGDTAYICGGDGVSAWNLTTQTMQRTIPARPGLMFLTDVADGYLAWIDHEGDDAARGTVVTRDPEAEQPRYRQVRASRLSPNAHYIWGVQSTRSSQTLLLDRTTNQEVELAMPAYQEWFVLQWIDNHRFTAAGYAAEDYEGDPSDAPDLLTCDAASGDCAVVGQATGGRLNYPNGLSFWP